MSDDARRYSESEVEEIFERATDVQAKGGGSRPTRDGLSLEEIQEMGRDPESMTALILVGAVFLAVNLFRLPRWAGTRERQMEEVAGRVRGWVESRDPDETTSTGT